MYSPCFVQSTGEFYAVSRLSGATPPPPYVISRGIGWEVSLWFHLVIWEFQVTRIFYAFEWGMVWGSAGLVSFLTDTIRVL